MKSGASVLYIKLPEKCELRENRHRDSDVLLLVVNGFLHIISPIFSRLWVKLDIEYPEAITSKACVIFVKFGLWNGILYLRE